MNKQNSGHLRNFVFGVEDSLVSTIGLLSGVAIAGLTRGQIISTGLILIFVEALSMSAGSLLSDNSEKEYQEKKHVPLQKSFSNSLIMFISYFFSGFVPLSPYLFLSAPNAVPVSIILSLVALAGLGFFHSKISKINPIKSALEMVLIGGAVIVVALTIGQLSKSF